MTLVERFIDFGDWPASRKTALAAVGAGLTHLLGIACVLLLQPPGLDVSMFIRIALSGFVLAGAIGAVSQLVYRRGHDGRWTAYVLVNLYAVWVVLFVVALGGITSPFMAFPLLLPLLIALWFDPRAGVVSIVWYGLLLVVAGVLIATGVIPFAPAMTTREFDDLRSAPWFVFVFLLLSSTTAMLYLMGILTVASARLQRQRLSAAHTRLEAAHRLIQRYVPEQVAEAVLSDTPEAIERHERRKLTIFFSDLVGFTDLSDEMEPEDLATVLHDYFTEMSTIARKHGGTVDDLIGDAILVFFGAPDFTDDRDQALRAVRMAIEMQAAMGPLHERWASAGIPETLTVRMGVNTGVATVGNFGSSDRTKYTALGKQVNIAARIQARCEPGKVLIGHATWLLVRDEIACVPKGELELKGLRKPMAAYEVRG